MKNKIVITIILIAMLLSACSAASTVAQSPSSSKTKSFAGQAELIVGVLKLEGTEQAVTAKQASDLLMLWEMDKVLADSDTAAQVEIDATYNQIKQTLTPDQLKAIAEMELTAQDVSAFEQSLNESITTQGSSKTTVSNNAGAGGSLGGGPGGDSLGGIVSGMSQVQSSTTNTKSTQVTTQTTGQIPTALLQAVINLLQKRANA